MEWLEIPTWLFWAFVKMLPAIQAGETLQIINAHAAAAGTMEKNGRRQYVSDLQRRAAGPYARPPRARRPKSMKELMALAGGTTKFA